MGDNQGPIGMRKIIEASRRKTEQDFNGSLSLTSWAEAIHYLRSAISSRGLWSAIYF